jgi:uncharacterized protein
MPIDIHLRVSKGFIIASTQSLYRTILIWRTRFNRLHLSMKIDELKIEQIKELCKSNKVKSLFAFGSVTRDDFNESSDVDLVVDFDEKDPFKYTDLYFNLKLKLEEILKKQVDLIEERAIRNRIFRQQLENTKVKIYGY